MAHEEWYTPAAESGPTETVAAAPQPTGFELRPLTLGEILDRTFAVYRSRFLLFVGIASLAGIVRLVLDVVQVIVQHKLRAAGLANTVEARYLAVLAAALILGVFVFLASSLTQAATVFAVGEVYLGRTTTIAASMRAVLGKWLRFIGIAIWQAWSFLWVGMVLVIPAILLTATGVTGFQVLGGLLLFVAMLGGTVAGILLYLRNSLAVPASVIEGLGVTAAMRRSKALAVGTKGRIFMVLLISGILYMVVGMAEMPLAFVVAQATLHHKEALGSQAGVLLINFAGYTLVGPVAMIGLALLYFDQRVRMEAFDLMFLLGAEVPSVVAAEAPAPFAPELAGSEIAMEAPVAEVTAAEAAPETAEATASVATPPATEAAETTTETDAGRPDDATGL